MQFKEAERRELRAVSICEGPFTLCQFETRGKLNLKKEKFEEGKRAF